MSVSSANGSTMSVRSSNISGLLNGKSSEDGLLSDNRWTGRKGRRQKTSTKSLDGKRHIVKSENIEFGNSRGLVEEQARLLDGVHTVGNTYHAHQKMPFSSGFRLLQRIPLEANKHCGSPNGIMNDVVNINDVFGTGLQNEVGEYNCFLNVIIQSLWHLRWFQDGFLRRSTSDHVHIGDPCVVCALYDIFKALNNVSVDAQREAVALNSLRIALSNLYPDSNFFQEAQMNDGSEVLAV